MPIFQLPDEIIFPPAHLASESGIIAVGGDLSPERLLEAYRYGIFPWYSEDDPILWWSPDPRFVLFPDELKVSRTMRQVMSRKVYTITIDRKFGDVIDACRRPRRKQPGTWITDEMREAYCALYDLGYAHSVEVWRGDSLAGGLYGVSLGRCFFGESMFSGEANASKAALVFLVHRLRDLGFIVIDCQVYTAHMASMGARDIPRDEFIKMLASSLQYPTLKGNWNIMPEFSSAQL